MKSAALWLYGGYKRANASLVIFSFLLALITANFMAVHGSTGAYMTPGAFANVIVASAPTLFAALIGMSCVPFVVLTVLSGAGNLLNAGVIHADSIPLSETLMGLPISQFNIFIILLIITLLNWLLSLSSVSKFLCEMTIGKIESLVGLLTAIVGPYLVFTAVTVYASGITATPLAGGFIAPVATGIAVVFVPIIAFIIYYLVKTFISAINIAVSFFSLIPGMSAIYSTFKYIIIGLYAWLALFHPMIASFVGAIILLFAVIFFRWATRVIKYFRHIHLYPTLGAIVNSLFRMKREVALLPKRMPTGITSCFGKIDVCILAFIRNNTTPLRKWEHCYYVRADGANYLYKRRRFSKPIKIPFEGKGIIEEKKFAFVLKHLNISTNKGVWIDIDIPRKHIQNKERLITIAELTRAKNKGRQLFAWPFGTKKKASIKRGH